MIFSIFLIYSNPPNIIIPPFIIENCSKLRGIINAVILIVYRKIESADHFFFHSRLISKSEGESTTHQFS